MICPENNKLFGARDTRRVILSKIVHAKRDFKDMEFDLAPLTAYLALILYTIECESFTRLKHRYPAFWRASGSPVIQSDSEIVYVEWELVFRLHTFYFTTNVSIHILAIQELREVSQRITSLDNCDEHRSHDITHYYNDAKTHPLPRHTLSPPPSLPLN